MYKDDCRYQWKALRSTVSASDTALSNFYYINWPASGTFDFKNTFPAANGAKILFYGSDAANEVAAYILYGRNRSNGPIQKLCAGNATLGTRPCLFDPITGSAITLGKWADTITVATGVLGEVDVLSNSAGDDICQLTIPMQGIVDLFCEFSLTTAAKAGAIISGITLI